MRSCLTTYEKVNHFLCFCVADGEAAWEGS